MSTDAFADFVVGHGELWSAQLMAACIKQLGGDVRFMDTRDVLVVTPTSDGSSVDLQEDVSNTRLDQWFTKHGTPKVGKSAGWPGLGWQGCVRRVLSGVGRAKCRADAGWHDVGSSW
jgi:aspartokinase/homoserine dehydrogenase 1